ncbi:carbohydrate ABC transporter membrane protein 2 (CUT1 family) [Hydrogenispora ethanolica]|uniref:Carbohydrate ABC transporter membrane protein 2 (CUT1 family) n=1 Tax=Hydrogenispora ethanolica TaxID=1082276 RepID=A0A4R1S4C9_HYDET|nr:carbohydrate ABC transporter permease [Hydrogenispora ethanolica]TCL74113.1 carbohydrate ABC transporter membrane protein 2 (CUT1 family) [Hydrogenispora ethanolica]
MANETAVAAKSRQVIGKRRKNRKIAFEVTRHILIYLILLVVLFPLIWMVLASFKTQVQIMSVDQNPFQFTPTFKNYVAVFSEYNFLGPIKNSFIIAFLSILYALILGLPAAYAIARFQQKLFGLIILVVRIIPGITFLVPWYILFTQIGLVDTYTALILTHMLVALPFVIWIMIPYFESLPRELEEAAWVDGSSRVGTFFRIILPLSGPGIITSSILSFIFSWNNFMFSLILSGTNTKTLPIAVFSFVSYSQINWGGLMAAAVVITAPILIISLFLQRYIIKGLTAGAVKG